MDGDTGTRNARSDASLFKRRDFLKILAAVAPGVQCLRSTRPAFAETYPSRPIRVVVPYAPGGGTDLLMRTLQQPLSAALGQPIIVDNKPGASGAIAAREVARSAPDGYTLFVSNNGPSAIVPLLQPDAGYDPIKDFAPITTIAVTPIVMIANPAVPAKDLSEFISWARQQADGVTYGSAGVGSLGHLSAELFAKMSDVKLVHAPYRGQAPTVMAVLSGETQIAFTSSSDSLLSFIKEGKIDLLGIGSKAPSPLVPGGVPIANTLPGYESDVWQGVLAPAGTPSAAIARIREELAAILSSPEMQAKFIKFSYAASTDSSDDFARKIETEVDHWRAIIRDRGIHVDN